MDIPNSSLQLPEVEQLPEASSESTGFQRRRVRKACEPCRQRKVKCDGAYPCKVCTGYEYDCYFLNITKKSAGDNQSLKPLVVKPKLSDVSSKRKNAAPVGNTEPKKKVYVISDETCPLSTTSTGFTRVDSAIAFPRSLGMSLNINDPPKITAFAWNAGTRSEIVAPGRPRLFDYITLKDVEKFSQVYFDVVHPVFEILDQSKFEQQKNLCWSSQVIDAGFEAVICGVVSLGSLYSTTGTFAYESEIVEHGRLTLDSTFAHARVLLSVEFVAAWILRALYLRNTEKPHLSWIASSMAMHTAESIGLHQEISDVKTTTPQPRIISEAEIEIRRRTFWTAASLNRYFACHFGRTIITLQNVGCHFPTSRPGDMMTFTELIRMVPLDGATPSAVSKETLIEALTKVSAVTNLTPPLVLLRADICFCMYRRLRYMGTMLSPPEIQMFLSIIREALDAVKSLANDRQQWWLLTGVPFHSTCVLLAMNNVESLSLLPEAMSTLKLITTIFGTPNVKESFQVVFSLVQGAEAKKRKEFDYIQQSLAMQSTDPVLEPQLDLPDFPSFEWPTDLDLVWSDGLGFNNFGPMIV